MIHINQTTRYISLLLLALLALFGTLAVMAQDDETITIDDFEMDELFLGQADGADVGYVPWGDTPGNVSLSLVEAERDSEATQALEVTYDIGAWGGFSHVFTDGESWTPQNWTDFNAISFWVRGANTGMEIQLDLFDNRNPDMPGDTAERYFFRFTDDSDEWKRVEIPFVDFQRRSDFQPGGAPDDGLSLNAVSGYAFGMPTGSAVVLLDDIQLFTMDGVDLPETVVLDIEAVVEADDVEAEVVEVDEVDTEETEPEVAQLPEVTPNEDLLGEMPFAEPMVISDFEDGLAVISGEGADSGYIPWGDTTGNTQLGITQVAPFTELAISDEDGFNQVFRIDYNIGAWGGFTHAFTDGISWISQDWSNHNALQFWLYGANTGQVIQVEIFDNRAPDSTTDTAERYFYRLVDDYEGWQQYTIPFAFFQRRTDFQPGGAPNDGLGLDEVSGYAFGFPPGTGDTTAYIDQVQVIVVEDPATVQITAPEEDITSVEIDESITWDSREWELMWSDEFELAAGEPINPEYWTCEVGGQGWGNQEHQYYTTSTDNAAHDGDGNLVITAIEEPTEDDTCWYGECLYTSARCITQDKVEFTYGRVEARINIPDGQGIWPAFWMLGANFPEVGWPQSGEIDIMENIGREPNTVHGTIHGPGYSGSNGIGGSYVSDEAFTDDFHVYAIDWDPYVIRWYVDGELFNTISVNDLNGRTWVYDHDFFLLMNIAVGGLWPGYPDDTTEFPQEMVVDYVRVYQLADEAN